MDTTRETAFRAQLLLFVILCIILDYGTANEDQPQSEDLSRALGNPKAMVAVIVGGRQRRERDVGLNNPHDCYPDEYYSDYYQNCKGCTRCSPGTQHNPQERCGHGQGQEAHCTPCEDGYYQSNEGIAILTCQPCLVCDPRAIVKRTCTRRRNTVCGNCQKGLYYDENNVCVECTEADMTDPTKEDCYVQPDPTPGPRITPEPRPPLGQFPQLDPSTESPVSKEDGASPEPVLKFGTPGKVVKQNPGMTLDSMHVVLIGVSVAAAAACVGFVVLFFLYRRKNKEGRGVPPPAHNDYERAPLRVEGEKKPDHQRQGRSGEMNGSLQGLVPPSSQSPGNESGLPSCPVDPDQGEPQTRNFVTRDIVHPPCTLPQDSSLDGPLSVPKPLKSFRNGDCGAGSQVPDMPVEGSQSPKKKYDPGSQATNHVINKDDPDRNYDVAKDLSVYSCSEIFPLSSLVEHNTPRSTKTQV